MSEAQQSRPRVALVVADDTVSDGRVRREGLALVRAGFEVTLLTVGGGARRRESRLGAMQVVRLAVPTTMRDARREGMARRRAWVPPIGYGSPLAQRAALGQIQASRLAVASSTSPKVASVVVTLRARTLSACALAQRALGRALRIGWHSLDTTVDRVPAGASWRRRLPETGDHEAVFGPELDRLEADALLVHGVALIGVVARVSARAALAGRQVPWVYDVDADLASPQPGSARSSRDRAATLALEKSFVRYAARVVVANDALADVVRGRYGRSSPPLVVTTDDVAPIGRLYVDLLGVENLEPRPDQPGDDAQEVAAPPAQVQGILPGA